MFAGFALGRIRIAYNLREQEKQLEGVCSENREDAWCPVPSGPIKDTPGEAPFGLLVLLFLSGSDKSALGVLVVVSGELSGGSL